MNETNFALASQPGLVDANYVKQGADARRMREKAVQTLLAQRRLPEDGWDELSIRLFLDELASMDTNNFVGNVGAGEREGRVFSRLVADRHYHFAHGIGRSGDIYATQPKAAGSSLIYRLTTFMTLHALKLAGLETVKNCLIVPTATGLAHVLALSSIKQTRSASAKYVIWPRIDQQTCFKAIASAGLEGVVVPGQLENDQIITDMQAIEATIDRLGADSVVCILSTTSCFAPRAADNVVDIARLCKKVNIPHLINNAYGVQCKELCAHVVKASRCGRVDACIQSTDKNFMVPVGGAIIASFDINLAEAISKNYPGRASMSPILDLFITLLSMGVKGYTKLLEQREALFPYFKEQLSSLMQSVGERLLHTPRNPISCAMTINSLQSPSDKGPHQLDSKQPNTADTSKAATFVGSMLFSRNVSGVRAVGRSTTKKIAGITFNGYGAHIDNYPHNYLTAACAIGMTKSDVDQFMERLGRVLMQVRERDRRRAQPESSDNANSNSDPVLQSSDKQTSAGSRGSVVRKKATVKERGDGAVDPAEAARAIPVSRTELEQKKDDEPETRFTTIHLSSAATLTEVMPISTYTGRAAPAPVVAGPNTARHEPADGSYHASSEPAGAIPAQLPQASTATSESQPRRRSSFVSLGVSSSLHRL